MKKMIFALVFVLTIQSMAFAMPSQSLKAVYQDYLYSTTVEWDQVDGEEISRIHAQFAEEIAALHEQGHLSEAALSELFETEIETGRLPREIIQEILGPSGSLNVKALRASLEKIQTQGANWTGTGKTIFKIVAWGFLPALIIIAVITQGGRKEMCAEGADTGYGLYDPYPCN